MNCIKCSDFSLAESNSTCGCCAQENTSYGYERSSGREAMCCRIRRAEAEDAILETVMQTLRNLQNTDALRKFAETLTAFTACCSD